MRVWIVIQQKDSFPTPTYPSPRSKPNACGKTAEHLEYAIIITAKGEKI
ncbi:MAG: hypothetical protein II118_06930 [Ruminococcus sp.]|nr:hypothetical protein [Ruminococcus sp.]